MTDQELLKFDQIGFIPGPDESEDEFLARIDASKKRYENGSWIPEPHWDWVREYLFELFHVKPLYICAFYSNRNLAPWQGAAAWVEGRNLHSVQMRKGLEKGAYLNLYRREEILSHEAVHGVRSSFNENSAEEFFAYMTSEKKWRRVLGPIFRRPWEAWPFLFFMLGGILYAPLYLGGAIWAGFGFWRLIQGHARLKKAAERIHQITKEPRKTRAVLFRLTDEEIRQFSKGISIESYAEKQTCLRWKVIRNYLRCG